MLNELFVCKLVGKRAKIYYEKAANKGHARAMVFLGTLYYNGSGAEKNFDLAKYWYKKGCSLNEKKGCEYYEILNK